LKALHKYFDAFIVGYKPDLFDVQLGRGELNIDHIELRTVRWWWRRGRAQRRPLLWRRRGRHRRDGARRPVCVGAAYCGERGECGRARGAGVCEYSSPLRALHSIHAVSAVSPSPVAGGGSGGGGGAAAVAAATAAAGRPAACFNAPCVA
jgi:hypothetical protein